MVADSFYKEEFHGFDAVFPPFYAAAGRLLFLGIVPPLCSALFSHFLLLLDRASAEKTACPSPAGCSCPTRNTLLEESSSLSRRSVDKDQKMRKRRVQEVDGLYMAALSL
jgi:hypothetical protein